MISKILPVILPIVILSSCSTAYRSGQTPDDVYYSPARELRDEKEKEEQREYSQRSNAVDYEIAMGIRDRRWRDFREDYEYNNSPYYKYCVCSCTSSGYYYNPYYYPWAIYTTYATNTRLNSTPRMVNLNTYKGYNTRVASGKTNSTISFSGGRVYNNSNRSTSPSQARQVLVPTSSEGSSNNSRSYNPSSGSSNRSSSSGSSSGSSRSGSSSSGSVSRPNRGG